MDMGGGASGGGESMGMMMPPPTSSPGHPMGHEKKMMMHMTFFWGKRTEILFSNWPGDRGLGMYLLALLSVLLLAVIAEVLSAASDRLSRSRDSGRRAPGQALLLTALHAVRLGLAYMVMLAVMSFNGGVLIAAISGHALGFLLARSGLLQQAGSDQDGNGGGPLPAPKM
ncbi:copper transporter 6 isoform X2 [Canna indica]|uniref:Copper transport protein n=1 Tax=Canna indica TaxID=4628 RepID=A0AAQ3KE34_9LILI|nr:copper transporter 6 isoform X2 [Canna indica]